MYINKLKQENLLTIQNYKKIIDEQIKENQNLKNELEIVKKAGNNHIETGEVKEQDKLINGIASSHLSKIAEITNEENLLKLEDKKLENSRNNSKQVISKNGVIIPKLDLSVIIKSRKMEAIVIAKPINESTKSNSDFNIINNKNTKTKNDNKIQQHKIK